MFFSIETSIAVAFLTIIPVAISLWLKKLSSFRTIRNKHVVITGGSSGIGFSIAKRCVNLGANVTIISRSEKKLESAFDVMKSHRINDQQMIQFRSIDLSKSDEAVKTMFSELENDVGSIYWLVNCAGGMMHSRIVDMFPEDPVHLMNIKYYAVYYPTRYVLERMKSIGEGIVTITGSQAKELVMEIYGHGPHGECKLSSLGLAKIINSKELHSKISITLALEGITRKLRWRRKCITFNFKLFLFYFQANYFMFYSTDTSILDAAGSTDDENEIQIISNGSSSASIEEIASQIVHDSMVRISIYRFLPYQKVTQFLF